MTQHYDAERVRCDRPVLTTGAKRGSGRETVSVAKAKDELCDPRVAIVAGGSRGIGRATAHRLAQCGYAVVVNYVHDQQTADSTVEAILDSGGNAVAVRADTSDEVDVERLFAATNEVFGAVDAVVHTVRGHLALSQTAEIALDDLDAMFRTTSRAAFVVNREASRHVRNGGAIVNLTGWLRPGASPSYGPYATAIAAVHALVRTLAVDLRERDIRVNGLSLDVDQPCATDRAADVIAYLVGGAGREITGQVLHVDDACARP
jgi:3-oxoacyl-[acyl-carrier protein] reductase